MMTLLAVVGAVIGLAVTGSAVLLAWSLYSQMKARSEEDAEESATEAEQSRAALHERAAAHLMRWTYFDYALFALFLIGSMFLFTDLIAVLRDAESYPPYHYGYLLCGFIFSFSGMLMMAVRLALTVSLGRPVGSRSVLPPNHHHQPSHAEHAE